jgi:sigma-E factor negative regulatory protein RseC
MIEESGEIVGIDGEFAWIEGIRTATCGGCSVRRGCGTAALSRAMGNRHVRLRVLNRINARVGDSVVIGIPESGLLRGSLAVYAVPLLALFGGALFGDMLGGVFGADGSEPAAIAGAVAGFGAGLLWLKRFSRRIAANATFQPVILRRQIMVKGA